MTAATPSRVERRAQGSSMPSTGGASVGSDPSPSTTPVEEGDRSYTAGATGVCSSISRSVMVGALPAGELPYDLAAGGAVVHQASVPQAEAAAGPVGEVELVRRHHGGDTGGHH